MNKKYREESINEFRESKKEYDKVRAEGKCIMIRKFQNIGK